MTHDELEDWERLQYRMDDEGFAYCFDVYSHWKEIEDEEFHRLRTEFIKSMRELRDYINNKVESGRNELED